MKGATTEPWASISKPPNINIIMMIGASHNFLRTRRKAKSSFKISIYLPILELLFKRLRFNLFTSSNPITWFLAKL
jgi:hypothetical protein